ncbi:MAG: hypothetical protein K1000chlam4_00604 [Chlamydiae bacterium]|nr:hypothetical protein [Chlamydiota bacterium]
MTKKFYSRLSYSIGNEDWKSDHVALKLQPKDRVLCVTASGDRPLNLLHSECQEIVAVDANPWQNALLDLKKAAMEKLDYEHYLAFLGVKNHSNRLGTLDSLGKDKSITQWKKKAKQIKKGILYQGATEKCTQIASTLVGALRRKKIEKLFSFDNLEEQQEFVKTHWDTFLWKKTFDIVLHPFITRLFLKDPGLYQYVDKSIHPGNYIYSRINHALMQFKAKESIIISLALKGKIFEEAHSPHLTESGVNIIKSRLDRISSETADLLSYLETAPDNSFDCFSLSDVASYISKETFDRLMGAVYRVARPNARFCIRQFMSRHAIPEAIASHFHRDHALEKKLDHEDRCFLYKFMVGKIIKSGSA